MSNNLAELLHKINYNSNQKIGSTTTINEQVDQMEVNLYHFKRFYENQQKQQSQLQFQLTKIQKATKTNFIEMNKQISDRIDYLTQLLKTDSQKQNGQFQYLEQQNKILHEQHDKINEIEVNSDRRIETIENSIGI